MKQLSHLMDFIDHELNSSGTELNAYVKEVAQFENATFVHIEFLPEGILPSGVYKLISAFICKDVNMQGTTIARSLYTRYGTLHGIELRLHDIIPLPDEVYDIDKRGVKNEQITEMPSEKA